MGSLIMAIIYYDVDNLIVEKLDVYSLTQLIQTKKYWKKRLQWFIDDYNTIRQSPYFRETFEFYFAKACSLGLFRFAKQLWENHIINIHFGYEFAFRCVCTIGHFEIAKWLWEISNGTIDIHIHDDIVFILACGSGHLHIAQWLWKISNHTILINSHVMNDTWLLIIDHFEVTKWLWKISNHMCRPPYQMYGFPNGWAFEYVCNKEDVEFAQWLSSIDTRYRLKLDENGKIANYRID